MATDARKIDRDGIDTALLIGSLFLGIALSITLKLMDIWPWAPALASAAVIAFYAIVTYNSSKARLEPEQIGDNCYYMGFCITLASMAYTLYQLGASNSDATLLNDVIAGFGVAVSSTAAGVIARVILLQFRVDLVARDKEARQELNQVMRAFHGEMRAAVESTAETSTQIRQMLSEHVEQAVAQNGRMQESFEKRLEALVAETGSNVNAAMDEVIESGKEMNRRLSASSRANTTSAEKAIVSSMETVVEDLKRVASAFEAGMQRANERSVASLETLVTEVTAAMRLLGEETRSSVQKARDIQAAETTAAVQALTENVRELAGEFGRQKNRIGDVLDGHVRDAADARAAAEKAAADNAAAQAEMRRAADTAAAAFQALADSAGRIEQSVSRLPKAGPVAQSTTPAFTGTVPPSGAGALKSGTASVALPTGGAVSPGDGVIPQDLATKQKGAPIWGKLSLNGGRNR